jgi:hypothetical protein
MQPAIQKVGPLQVLPRALTRDALRCLVSGPTPDFVLRLARMLTERAWAQPLFASPRRMIVLALDVLANRRVGMQCVLQDNAEGEHHPEDALVVAVLSLRDQQVKGFLVSPFNAAEGRLAPDARAVAFEDTLT